MTNDDKKDLIEKLLMKRKVSCFRVEVSDSCGILIFTDSNVPLSLKHEISGIAGENHTVGFRNVPIEQFKDAVNHPSHYNQGKIEVIEFIEDQGLDYHSGNTVKYICRAGKKDPTKEIEDLEKAAWYLKRRIETLKAKRDMRETVRPNEMKK
jgi:hypothetical protein